MMVQERTVINMSAITDHAQQSDIAKMTYVMANCCTQGGYIGVQLVSLHRPAHTTRRLFRCCHIPDRYAYQFIEKHRAFICIRHEYCLKMENVHITAAQLLPFITFSTSEI